MNHGRQFKIILSNLGFKQKRVFKVDLNRGILVVSGKIKTEAVLVKIISNKIKDKIVGLQKEAKIDKFLHLALEDTSFITQVKLVDSNGNYTWLVRDFYEGGALALYIKNEPLYGYDIIQKKYLRQGDYIVPSVIDCIRKIASIVPSEKIREDFSNRFEANLNNYPLQDIADGLELDLTSQMAFYEQIADSYLDDKNKGATSGDMVLSNILITKNDQVMLTDFEWFSFDNKLFDVSFLWLFLWRYPEWQSKLIKESIKNENDRLFFRASLIRQIIGWYKWTFSADNEQSPKLVFAKDFYKNHIWTNYLIAAGHSFEEIINL